MRSLRVGASLSLTGPYARFGVQAAAGLRAWCDLDEGARLVIEDDRGDRARLAAGLRTLARRCDLLLGPYSTGLTRTAVDVVRESGGLLWNHGGAGDDVQTSAPGQLVSVLTPASRYAEPYMRLLPRGGEGRPLCIVEGAGSFARQVADGARATARRIGVETAATPPSGPWDLFCAGSFEEDVAAVRDALARMPPPRTVCAVAAGVREFGEAIGEAEGVYGVAQWFPGRPAPIDTGPAEDVLLARYAERAGALPDYPAVQAVAGAALAVHCARTAGGLDRQSLWSAAIAMDRATLFGAFRVDPVTGMQLGHETVLVRWTSDGPTLEG